MYNVESIIYFNTSNESSYSLDNNTELKTKGLRIRRQKYRHTEKNKKVLLGVCKHRMNKRTMREKIINCHARAFKASHHPSFL
jgi:hypothetical protein